MRVLIAAPQLGFKAPRRDRYFFARQPYMWRVAAARQIDPRPRARQVPGIGA
jgi:hypothetical protein